MTPQQDFAAFLAAVDAHTEPVGDCLLWQRSCIGGAGGSPQMRYGATVVNIRRELAIGFGIIEAGDKAVVARMSCRNGCCLRPAHIEATPRTEVAAANSREGRRDPARASAAAKRHTRAASRLTPADVRAIFLSAETHEATAIRYGVSRSLVWKIKHREAWADVAVTSRQTPPGRFEPAISPGSGLFSGLGIGRYLQAEA